MFTAHGNVICCLALVLLIANELFFTMRLAVRCAPGPVGFGWILGDGIRGFKSRLCSWLQKHVSSVQEALDECACLWLHGGCGWQHLESFGMGIPVLWIGGEDGIGGYAVLALVVTHVMASWASGILVVRQQALLVCGFTGVPGRRLGSGAWRAHRLGRRREIYHRRRWRCVWRETATGRVRRSIVDLRGHGGQRVGKGEARAQLCSMRGGRMGRRGRLKKAGVRLEA